ncbi:PIN domain-containing protein [Actinocrinis puniceicyclus]|uniref:PIN domain-containing protein n=1 Tax=Actinocrinis puniceicyclus TaxID=977794 RepID=A0A8J8BBQ0_9ACTN|nr:PIN domain-containing protein [Actinocrinis puniceicyclus]MBS2962695.1 PIN domain-containing protein [Actinocrinis puniceicyclus]
MGRRLILDTCILIDMERGRLRRCDFATLDDELSIATVTVAELWEGVVRADPARRSGRADFFERILEQIPIEDYTLATAQRHGELLALTHVTGTKRGSIDLIIAATAAQTGRIIISRDGKASFDDLPGVRVEFPKQSE